MPITPDTKDWTWVLERPCPECGFDASTTPGSGVADLLRHTARDWQVILAGHEPLTERPSDDRWSALEYACHVRDVFAICEGRLMLMLVEDGTRFPNWDQDITAVEDRYNEQDRVTVSRDLVAGADRFARRFERIEGTQWERKGIRSDGARFTVDTFARYMIHDPIHHLWDVHQGFTMLAARA